VATVLLVRHGRTSANSAGVLAGRTAGVGLDDAGKRQAADLGARMADLPLVLVVTSPLERCRQTATALVRAHSAAVPLVTDRRLIECGYGEWTGKPLKDLAKDPLWRVVQQHPSAVRFPGGESMSDMQARALAAIREQDAAVTKEHGPDALWVAVSHGDVLKSIIADAAGSHLDSFQRIVVDPGSVSVVSYTPMRPFVVRLNEHGDLSALVPKKKPSRRRRSAAASSDAPVGGGAGAAT
jgi:probable phosphomutase (TIGR03848 family)